jgi:GntR family transcriptional regulator of arabinose operon
MAQKINIPKYEIIKNYIRHMLQDEIIAYGMQLPSEHELMEKFKVSRQTVRQAFTELAGEGLIYKEQGRGTFSNFTKTKRQNQTIAVITTYMSGFVFPGIIAGIEQVLSDEGYMILLTNTNNSKEREKQYLKSVLEHNVTGAIIEPTKSAHENINIKLLEEIKNRGVKTVFINANYSDFDSSFVVMDDVKGGYMAAEYLIQLGHKSIAGIFKTDDRQGVDRKNGYLKALREYDIKIDNRYIGEYETLNMYDYPYMYTQSLFREQTPTAIVCYNDQCALLAIQAISDSGLRIPGDVSVVGYDDSLSMVHTGLKLTTIRHPKEELGIQAAKYLIAMIEGRSEKPQMVLQPELIVRNSCQNI